MNKFRYRVQSERKCCKNCSNYHEYLKYGDDIFDEECLLTKERVNENGICSKWTDK